MTGPWAPRGEKPLDSWFDHDRLGLAGLGFGLVPHVLCLGRRPSIRARSRGSPSLELESPAWPRAIELEPNVN